MFWFMTASLYFFYCFFFERLWVLCTHIMHLYVSIQYISYHLVMSTLYNLATLGSPVYVHDSPVDAPSSCTEHWAQMVILVLCLISINQAITTSDSLTTYPIILATRKSSHKLQLQCQSVLKVWCWVKKVSQMCLVRHCKTFWYLYEPRLSLYNRGSPWYSFAVCIWWSGDTLNLYY